jgi:chemotaxis protein methyltransferase CheR
MAAVLPRNRRHQLRARTTTGRSSEVTGQAKEREFAFTDRDFGDIAELIHSHVGIVLPAHKKDMVYARLSRRLRALGLQRFKDYMILVGNREDELEQLVNALTTNVTSFFRENHHFTHLTSEVAPYLLHHNLKQKRVRLWSAGCSQGMEAYSMAMSILHGMHDPDGWDIKILATDIDTNVLEVGRRGRYDQAQLMKIPQSLAAKYVKHDKETRGVIMGQKLRDIVRFNQLNLHEQWPMTGTFDAIFCRNVVIYFDKDTQRALFNRYADILAPHGWLYVGHSENLFNVSDRFECVGQTIYRKR